MTDLRRALAEGGKAAVTGFTSVGHLMGVSLRGGKDIAQVQAHATTKDLELLSELIEAGKVRPQIDRRYPFAEIPAAIRLPGTRPRQGEGSSEDGVSDI